jgi:hypothetical protein
MRNSWAIGVITLVVLSVSFTPDVAFGRINWLERDGRAIFLHPRRILENPPPEIGQLSNACPSGTGVCATLAGEFINTLLTPAPECAQQDAADGIISQLQFFAEACASS